MKSKLLKLLGITKFQSTPNRTCYYWRNTIIWFTEKQNIMKNFSYPECYKEINNLMKLIDSTVTKQFYEANPDAWFTLGINQQGNTKVCQMLFFNRKIEDDRTLFLTKTGVMYEYRLFIEVARTLDRIHFRHPSGNWQTYFITNPYLIKMLQNCLELDKDGYLHQKFMFEESICHPKFPFNASTKSYTQGVAPQLRWLQKLIVEQYQPDYNVKFSIAGIKEFEYNKDTKVYS